MILCVISLEFHDLNILLSTQSKSNSYTPSLQSTTSLIFKDVLIVNLFLSGIWITYIKPLMQFTYLKVILIVLLFFIFWILVLLVYLAINNFFIFLADFLHLSHIFFICYYQETGFLFVYFFPSQIDIVFSLKIGSLSLLYTQSSAYFTKKIIR